MCNANLASSIVFPSPDFPLSTMIGFCLSSKGFDPWESDKVHSESQLCFFSAYHPAMRDFDDHRLCISSVARTREDDRRSIEFYSRENWSFDHVLNWRQITKKSSVWLITDHWRILLRRNICLDTISRSLERESVSLDVRILRDLRFSPERQERQHHIISMQSERTSGVSHVHGPWKNRDHCRSNRNAWVARRERS